MDLVQIGLCALGPLKRSWRNCRLLGFLVTMEERPGGEKSRGRQDWQWERGKWGALGPKQGKSCVGAEPGHPAPPGPPGARGPQPSHTAAPETASLVLFPVPTGRGPQPEHAPPPSLCVGFPSQSQVGRPRPGFLACQLFSRLWEPPLALTKCEVSFEVELLISEMSRALPAFKIRPPDPGLRTFAKFARLYSVFPSLEENRKSLVTFMRSLGWLGS